jgi:hypothetical protein
MEVMIVVTVLIVISLVVLALREANVKADYNLPPGHKASGARKHWRGRVSWSAHHSV